ncbi:hypothetical protein [Arsenophonus sp. PmNCSU2021_1]|uniref:hypothetical protein n=1 Tax=Arsenophonus sp. PmNCSU2021_1 TaxID=3118989 RepID=UPI002FF0EDF8
MDALAWRLSAELARSLASNASIGNESFQLYQLAIQNAAAHSLSESSEPTDYIDEFTAARLS